MTADGENPACQRSGGIQRADRARQDLIRKSHRAENIVDGTRVAFFQTVAISVKIVSCRMGGLLHGNIIYRKISNTINFIMTKELVEVKIPALDRGLDLLEWIAGMEEPVTLTHIAHGLGLSVSEVQRPVACLHRRGYLHRSEAGAYTLSGRLAGLAGMHPPHQRLQKAALGVMVEFSRTHRESIHLCVPDWDSVLLLLDVPGGGLVRLSLQQGARFDMLGTVSGRILSAHGAFALPKLEKTDLSNLKKIRTQGFEHAASSQVMGITDTGVPVFDSTGRIVAALTVSSLQAKGETKRAQSLVSFLRASANRITDLL